MVKRTNGVITMQKIKVFFLSLILILSISTGVRAEYFSDVIVTSSDGIWTDSRAYTTLNDAIAAVGTNQRTVVIASPQTVTNLTVPSNVTLKFERDGSIVNSGQLTINTKSIIADDHKIFAGLGDIDFATGTIVKLSWFHNLWNALTMTSDDTVTLIINKAINATASCAVGNKVILKWEAPNIISANAGVTISNVGQIEAGNYQILAGAGNFRFRDGTLINLKWVPYLRTALTWINTNEVVLYVNESSTVDYSDAVPDNVQLKINKGGSLLISPGITLTINSAKQIDIGSFFFDPFAGTGSVTITGGLTYTPATDLSAHILQELIFDHTIDDVIISYNNTVDALVNYGGGTDYNDTTLMAACTAVGANESTIIIRNGTWTITNNRDFNAVCPNAIFKTSPGTLLTGAGTLVFPTGNIIPLSVFSNISDGISMLSTSQIIFLIDKDANVTASLIIPINITIDRLDSYIFNISTTKTLTINGKFKSSVEQVFNCNGTGIVVFGEGAVREGFLEWFDTSSGTNYAVAMGKFVASGIKHLTLLPYKTYDVGASGADCLLWDGVDGIVIDGNFATIKIAASTSLSYGFGVWIKDADGVTIRNLIVDGNRANLAYNVDGQSHGVFLQYVRNAVLDNLIIKEMASDSLYIGCDSTDETLRSENIEVRNSQLYRARRNNISFVGAKNVTVTGGSIKAAGEASGSSTGTAPKSGIDFEPNTDGANYKNENITIRDVEFDDNVTSDIILSYYNSRIKIIGNDILATGKAITCTNSSTIDNLLIDTNYISGGTYGFLSSMTTGTLTDVILRNNYMINQTSRGLYMDGDSYAGIKVLFNTFYGNQQLMWFNPTTYTPNSHIFSGNKYISFNDDLAADSIIALWVKCWFENEYVYRTATTNSYRAQVNSAYATGHNIVVVGDHVTVYDANALYDFPGSLDRVIGSGIDVWRSTAAPVSGTWAVGAEVIITNPSSGNSPNYICTVAGSPGTWKGGANLK